MPTAPAQAELYAALFASKEAFGPITKNLQNPHFKHNYANLEQVLTAVEHVLRENGLMILQPCDAIGSDTENVLVTQVIHVATGQFLQSVYKLGAYTDPQKAASALTYARRYQILSLLCLVTADDDGNSAAAKDQPAQPPAQPPAAPPIDASHEQEWLDRLQATTTVDEAKAVGNAAWEAKQLTDSLKNSVAGTVAALEIAKS